MIPAHFFDELSKKVNALADINAFVDLASHWMVAS
jgi:hypothetical protein